MIEVLLYSLPDDPGTAEIVQALQELGADFPHQLIEIDISQDVALRAKYGDRAPVVEIGPYQLAAPTTKVDLQVALGAALDSDAGGAQADSSPWGMRLNRGLHSLSRHWLAALSLVVLLYVGLPFAAPTLMKIGATGPARVLYTFYSPFCHQLAFRSWFLFGDQPAYPRDLAGTSLQNFAAATGIDENDFLEARAFVGNEQVGYKVALCERDIGIYAGILLAGLAFGLTRDRVKPLPLKFWFLFGIVPIGLDGFSQLISQLGLLPFAARESTPFLRTLTGALFGAMNVWMAYPHLEATMRETRDMVAGKLAVAEQRAARTTQTPD